MNEKTDNLWDELERKVLSSSTDDIVSIKCPICEGGLRIRYVANDRPALNITCNKCQSRTWLDGISTVPAWVKENGNEFET